MIKLIIVSHKRPAYVTTTRYVKDAIICVPNSQKKIYEEYNKNIEIIGHPDEIIGLSPKRQWIYKTFGDVFFLDDDVIGVNRVYVGKGEEYKLKPHEITNWINDIYNLCKEINVKLFGFESNPNLIGYSGAKPFLMNKYITGGAFGILEDKNLYFPDIPNFVGEDYFINALNAYYNRMSFIDGRIAFNFKKTERNIGGCSDYRTEEERKYAYIYLKKCFGNAIVPKIKNNQKKMVNKYEKTLIIPY